MVVNEESEEGIWGREMLWLSRHSASPLAAQDGAVTVAGTGTGTGPE